MASAAFANFVTLPDIITEPGDYVTRQGEPVRIDFVSTKHDFGCQGKYGVTGEHEGWHKSGRLYFGIECRNDIVGRLQG